MSDSSSSPLPVPEQEVLLPTDDDPSSPSSSSLSDDDGDLVIEIATNHRQTQTYDGELQQLQGQWRRGSGRGPFTAMMPPTPALFAPWAVLGGGGGGDAPAPAASIEALPTVEVSEPGAVCAICKDDLPLAAAARRLPCGHLYHSSCIVPWLEVHNSCPICRRRLTGTEPAAREVAAPAPAAEPEQDTPPAARADVLQLPTQDVSGEGEETIVPSSV